VAGESTVRVEGLKELRKVLKATDRSVNLELGKDLRVAAGIVAQGASGLAPRQTGALAASYRGGGAGLRAYVRSTLPYAALIEFGGTTGRGHSASRPGATRVRAQAPVRRALEGSQDAVVEAVAHGIDVAARRAGWH
jgi:hypothetical protein